MSLPLRFGTRSRVTPTRAASADMPLIQMSIDYELTHAGVINPENAIDGNPNTVCNITNINQPLWIDLGGWYKIASAVCMYGPGGTDAVQLRGWRHRFTAESYTDEYAVLINEAALGARKMMIGLPTGADQVFVRWLQLIATAGGSAAHVRMILVSTT